MMGNLSCYVEVIFSFQPSKLFHIYKECCPSGGRIVSKFLIGLILLLALPFSKATAQADFTADITRGCAPLKITIADSSKGSLSNISYNYGDGTNYITIDPVTGVQTTSKRTTSPTHTYNQPGIYSVTQSGTVVIVGGGSTGDSLRKVNYIEVLPTPKPAFTASTCSGQVVRVQITDNVYESYLVNFGNGVTQSTVSGGVLTQTYTDTRPKTITVTGQYNVTRTDGTLQRCPNPGGGADSLVTITPIVGLPVPQLIGLTVQDASAAQLQFQVASQTQYRIEQKNAAGQFQTVATLNNLAPGVFTQALSNLNTVTDSYTFRVSAFDLCGNSVASDEVSSVVLNATAADSRNELSWQMNSTATFGTYSVFSNNALLATLNSPGQTVYTENDVRCPDQYCYRVAANLSGGVISLSNIVCVNATSTRQPPAVQNLRVTIEAGLPVLSWDATNSGQNDYFISRSVNGGAFQNISRVTAATFTDQNAKPNAFTYCYRVSYLDACNNRSADSPNACPVQLKIQESPGDYTLTWSAYHDWPTGVTAYTVERLDAAGQLLSTQEMGQNSTLTEALDTVHQLLLFRVQATGTGLSSYSNVVEVRQPVRIFLPEAFTPNEDGINDQYAAKGLFISSFQMAIYDRWGSVVFSSDSREKGWSGTINGQPAPAGTYVCLVNIVDQTGQKTSRKQGLLLIR